MEGKRPDAVFLDQIIRSPVVRGTTTAGYYEIDSKALDRLHQEKLRIESQIGRDVRRVTADPDSARAAGKRQTELLAELRRIQREIEEAADALGFTAGKSPLAA